MLSFSFSKFFLLKRQENELLIFSLVIRAMKPLFFLFLTFFLFSNRGNAQVYSFFLCNSERQAITGASLSINGKIATEKENGYYEVRDLSFTGNPHSKIKAVANHPDYSPLDDSLFVTQQIMLATPTQTSFFLSGGQKLPCAYYPSVSVIYSGDSKSRTAIYSALEKTGGRIIQEREACGSWKGEASDQGTFVTIAHDRLEDAIEFRKITNACSAIALGKSNNFLGVRPEVYILQEQYKPLNPQLTELLTQWKQDGYIESLFANPGLTTGYQITFSPEYAHEASNFLGIIAKEFPTMMMSQEMLSIICMD